jgi:integrase
MAWIRKAPSGRWRAEWRDPSGRKRSKTLRRKRDAEAFLAQIEADINRGIYRDPRGGKTRFGAFAQRWLDETVHLRPSTRQRYVGLLRRHILPRFGDLPLNAIRPLDVRAFVSDLTAQGLAPSTVRQTFVVLARILKSAEVSELIGRSPAVGVDLPEARHAEPRFLTAEQVAALADAIDPRYRAVVLLGAYGALRWGELAGLRCNRLRLLERKADIRETAIEVGGRLILGPPKTGERTVTLPAFVADELAAHMARWPDSQGFVFPAPEGGPLRRNNFASRYWVPAVEAAGLGPLRIHDLRHTGVALAIATGAHPKAIQERLGHASITTTLNVYGHLFASLEESLAVGLDDAHRDAAASARSRSEGGRVLPMRPRSTRQPRR